MNSTKTTSDYQPRWTFNCLRPDHTDVYDEHVLLEDYDDLLSKFKAALEQIQALSDPTNEYWNNIEFWKKRAEQADRRAAEAEKKYSELIYAVEKKFPDESRHATALRYIQERERYSSGPQSGVAAAREEKKP